jgi:hypothetical protein
VPDNPNDARSRIAAAFDRLKPPPGSEEQVKIVIDLLAIMAANPRPLRDVRPQSYRKVSAATTRKELDRLLGGLQQTLAASRAFHAGAIVALANRGVLRSRYEGVLQQLATEVEAAKADIKPQTPDAARPRNVKVIVVTSILLDAYEKIFRVNADLPNQTRGLPGLIREIFVVLDIGANPRASLADALVERAHRAIPLHDPAEANNWLTHWLVDPGPTKR